MRAGLISRREHWVFGALALAAFAYCAVRAFTVPITHDEAMTAFYYVVTGDFLPFRAHVDAGNHVLLTALAWCSESLFGLHTWALRLPSVLAYAAYAVAVFGLGAFLQRPVVRWSLWITLLCFPFLLDLFALFRGYGMGMAGLAWGLLAALRWWQHGRTKDMVLLVFSLACATWSNLSLLPIHALLMALIALRIFMHHRTEVKAWVIWTLGMLPLCVAAAWSLTLSKAGALYYGVDTGLLQGTLSSLLPYLLGVGGVAWAYAVALLFFAVIGYSVARVLRTDPSVLALVGTMLLLVADVLGRFVLFHINGTLYPEDRTALHWAFLFTLALAYAVDHFAIRKPRMAWGALLLLALPLHTLRNLHTDRTQYWPEQAIPTNVRTTLMQRAAEDPLLTIGMYHQLPAAWSFGFQERALPVLLPHTSGHPLQATDLLLIDPLHDSVPAGYLRRVGAATGRLELWERSGERGVARMVLDSLLPDRSTDDEYIALLEPTLGAYPGATLRIALDVRVEAPPMGLVLVTELDGGLPDRHYDLVLLDQVRARWQGDTLHTVRGLPPIPADATRLVTYFWNKHRKEVRIGGRIRVYHMSEAHNAASSPTP